MYVVGIYLLFPRFAVCGFVKPTNALSGDSTELEYVSYHCYGFIILTLGMANIKQQAALL